MPLATASPRRARGFAFAILAALFAPVSSNAGNATDVRTADSVIEEIVVTGTAIVGTPIDSPYAVDVVDRDALADRGSPALVDLFKDIGANAGAIGEVTSWLNGTGQTVPETVANVNLRGLGPSRTLVLFNGHRQVYVPAQLVGGRFVDVNVLPRIALQRIEVLKEGAAAVYGSDAVAGVVNFITRGDFEGFEIATSYEDFDGAGDTNLGAIWGTATGAGHFVLAVEHARRQALNLAERPWALPDDGSAYWGWSGTGNPGAFIVPGAYIPELSFHERLLHAERFVDPRCEDTGGENWGTTCGFRFGPWDNLIESQRQTRALGELTIDHDHGSYRFEALLARAEVPGWLTTPTSPPVAKYDGTQLVAADHPGRKALALKYGSLPSTEGRAIDLASDEDWYFLGRLVGNSGPGRSVRRDSTTFRLAAAAEGSLASKFVPLHYDVGIAWSGAELLMNRPAEYAYRRFLAFRGFGGPNCGVGIVADRKAPSGLALGRIQAGVRPGRGDCFYYNPFSNAIEYSAQPGSAFQSGPNPDYDPALANSPELFDWIGEEVRIDSESDLLTVDAILGGELSARASFATGYQFRRLSTSTRPSDPANLALNPCPIPGDTGCRSPTGLFASARGQLPFDADQTTHAVFAEVAVRLHERLDAQIALHHEQHDQAKSTDPKLALRLSLTDALSLRGSAQTTFRTPSVDDLNEDISTKLELLPAVGTFKAIETEGNPDLDPESAFTFNLGLVLQTNHGIDLTLDYWSYDFRDPVRVLPFRAVEAFYADRGTRDLVQELVFCPGNRNDGSCEASEVERIRVRSVNGPDTTTAGVDFHLGGSHSAPGGEFIWGIDATYILKYDVDPLQFNGAELISALDAVGYLNDPVDGTVPPLPKLKTGASATLRQRDFRFTCRLDHVASYEDRAREAGLRFADIDAYRTVDFTVSWHPADRRFAVSLSALNIGDQAPPLIASDHFFDGTTHDPKGRRLKLGIRYSLP